MAVIGFGLKSKGRVSQKFGHGKSAGRRHLRASTLNTDEAKRTRSPETHQSVSVFACETPIKRLPTAQRSAHKPPALISELDGLVRAPAEAQALWTRSAKEYCPRRARGSNQISRRPARAPVAQRLERASERALRQRAASKRFQRTRATRRHIPQRSSSSSVDRLQNWPVSLWLSSRSRSATCASLSSSSSSWCQFYLRIKPAKPRKTDWPALVCDIARCSLKRLTAIALSSEYKSPARISKRVYSKISSSPGREETLQTSGVVDRERVQESAFKNNKSAISIDK